MQFDDTLSAPVGVWDFKLFRGDSRDLADLVEHRVERNLITNSGKAQIMDRIFGLSSSVAITGLAVGTNSTAAAAGDTAITATGITGTSFKTFTTCTRSGLVVTSVADFGTADANGALTEAGLLTASGGVLLNRLTFSTLNKSSALSLSITVTVTQS